VATEPAAAEPAAIEPVGAEAEATLPAAAEPDATFPEATVPAATLPEGTLAAATLAAVALPVEPLRDAKSAFFAAARFLISDFFLTLISISALFWFFLSIPSCSLLMHSTCQTKRSLFQLVSCLF
jgi:hypothetical protein